MRKGRANLLLSAAAALCMLLSPSAVRAVGPPAAPASLPGSLSLSGGNITIGLASDNSLEVTQNGTAYTAAAGTTVVIDGAGGDKTVNNTAGATVLLQNGANPSSVTMSGGTLRLSGATPAGVQMAAGGTIETVTGSTGNQIGVLSAGGPVSVSLPAALACTTMDYTGSTGGYTLSSGSLTTGSAKNLTVSGGEATVNGALTGTNAASAGKLVLGASATGTDTLTASGTAVVESQAALADTKIQGGTVTAPSASGLAVSGGTTTLSGALSGASAVSGGTLSAASVSGTLTVSGSGGVTSSGNVAGAAVQGGSLTLTGGSLSGASVTGGTVSAIAASGLTVSGGTTTLSGALSGSNTLSGGKLKFDPAASVTGDLTVSGSGEVESQAALTDVTVQGGTVTAPSASGLTVSGGDVTLSAGSARAAGGELSGNNTVSGGTLTAGTLASGGAVSVGPGTLALGADPAGTVALNSGGTLKMPDGTAPSSNISFNGGTLLMGSSTSPAYRTVISGLSGAQVTIGGKDYGDGTYYIPQQASATYRSKDNLREATGAIDQHGATLAFTSVPTSPATCKCTLTAPAAYQFNPASLAPGAALDLSTARTGNAAGVLNGCPVSGHNAGTVAYSYQVVSGPASLSGSTLTVQPTAAGSIVIGVTASYNGKTDTKQATISVTAATCKCTLTAPAAYQFNPASLAPGAALDLSTARTGNAAGVLNGCPVSGHNAGTVAYSYQVVSGPASLSGSTLTVQPAATGNIVVSITASYNGKTDTKQVTIPVTAASCKCTLTAPAAYQFASPLLLPGAATADVDLAKTRVGDAAGKLNGCGVHASGTVAYSYSIAAGKAKVTGSTLQALPGATEISLDVIASYNGKTVTKRVTIPVGAVTLSSGVQTVKRGEAITLSLQNLGKISALTANGNNVSFSPAASSVTIDKSYTKTAKPVKIALTTANFGARTFSVQVDKYFATVPDNLTRRVDFGTSRASAAAELPKTARVKLDQKLSGAGDSVSMDLSGWTSDDYNPREPGDYVFTGTLTIPRKYRDDIAFDRNAQDAYTTTVEAVVTVRSRSGDKDDNKDDSTLEERRRLYWDGIIEEIQDAEPGDKIYADDRFDLMYAEVLEELQGKRVTLVIERNRGKDITINGKDVKKVPSNVVYYDMDELYDLYGKDVASSSSSAASSSRAASASSRPAASKPASSVPQVTTPPTVTAPVVPASSSSRSESSRASSSKPESSEPSESSEPDEIEVNKPVEPEPEEKPGVNPLVIVLIATAVAALAAGTICVILIRRQRG